MCPLQLLIPLTRLLQMRNMGFPEALCIEAYLACDKNSDLAINYILQRMDEFEAEVNQHMGPN